MELASRLRGRERREKEENEVPENSRESEENAYASSDMHSLSGSDSEATVDYDYSDSMLVNEVEHRLQKKETPETIRIKNQKQSEQGRKTQVKTLLNAIAGFF